MNDLDHNPGPCNQASAWGILRLKPYSGMARGSKSFSGRPCYSGYQQAILEVGARLGCEEPMDGGPMLAWYLMAGLAPLTPRPFLKHAANKSRSETLPELDLARRRTRTVTITAQESQHGRR